MDKPSLKALRELHEKATPGPWVAEVDDTPNRCAGIAGPTQYDDYAYRGDIVVTDSGVYPPRMPDAALIVAARNALPALLAIAEAARGFDEWASDHGDTCLKRDGHECNCGLEQLRAALAMVEE